MDKHIVENAIDEQLKSRKKKVLNRNAISALFGAFSDPVRALGKIFVGRDGAIDAEKQKIIQDVILEMLCKIDDAISQAAKESNSQGFILQGLIETIAHGAESVVGVHVGENSGSITMQAGTHIRTAATASKNVTGLKIGGQIEKE
ncbi:MAG: hypothetical protein M0Q01_06020 [Syntrophales bacterium]|jgi:hypothetical protein|nr:hypothetical protein [Syntrophales bacterium]